jgi:hypothetical protein
MDFDNILLSLGFKFDGPITYHCQESKCGRFENCMMYVQDSDEYYGPKTKSSDITWSKRYCCDKCLDDIMGCILCGGHYTNMRIFKNNEDISKDFDYSCYNLDPNEIFNDDEEDDEESNEDDSDEESDN